MQHHAVLLFSALPAKEAMLLYGDTTSYEVVVLEEGSIGIQEVRQLIHEALLKPSRGTHRLLVVRASGVTIEAQQALLKILEEPPLTTLFYCVIAPGVSLLPTLLSRFERLEDLGEIMESAVFQEFLALDLAARLDEITKRTTKKDQEWIEAMRSGLRTSVMNQKGQLSYEGVAYVLAHLATRGASNKMLLEELALSLPVLRLD